MNISNNHSFNSERMILVVVLTFSCLTCHFGNGNSIFCHFQADMGDGEGPVVVIWNGNETPSSQGQLRVQQNLLENSMGLTVFLN